MTNKRAFNRVDTNGFIHDVLQLSKQWNAICVSRRYFNAVDSEIESAGGAWTNRILVSQAEVGDGDVNIVNNSFKDFHEVTAFLFLFLVGGPFGSG